MIPLVPAWRVDRAFDYGVPDELERRIEIGSLARVPFGGRRVRGIVVALGRRDPARPLEEIDALVLDEPLCAPPLDELLEWMAERYAAPRGIVFARVVPPRVRVRALPPEPLRGGPPPARVLAYRNGAELIGALESGAAGGWCLQAAPGEDRGELVAELVAAAGRGGGTALVAVPEVRYGSLTLDRIEREWPSLARVESGRPPGDRARAWLRLAGGHGLGGGGRAVVLAPARALRLIVLDEEHHPSYKEDRAPRYDARRVALERARRAGAVCVLLSSTPSLETGHGVRSGELHAAYPERERLRTERPVVELVARPRTRAIAREVHRRIASELGAGGRVAILVPARGYARSMWCGSCRRSLRCPRCEAGLALDRGPRAGARSRVRCPRCGFEEAPPQACPLCGAVEWRLMGAGSQRLAEQVAKTWPRARVRRVDPDAPASAAADAPDIYVTTWIGTKAVLRPPVSLVAVLDADALIRRPDFRAAEHAYQALAEMAEWAGPARTGGRLLVQCSEPAHHAIQAVARADYRFFLERELEQRAELAYPPLGELVTARATGSSRRELLHQVAARCRALGATVLGPIPSPPATPGGLELLVKCVDAQRVARDLRGILALVPPGSRLRVDVDPR